MLIFIDKILNIMDGYSYILARTVTVVEKMQNAAEKDSLSNQKSISIPTAPKGRKKK